MHQGKRDVETVLTMGIMEDVSIIPQPAGNVYSQKWVLIKANNCKKEKLSALSAN